MNVASLIEDDISNIKNFKSFVKKTKMVNHLDF